ncbi:MAG: carbohydrate binding family 9 domain-containing protein [Gemmatimonadaceae bacterium]|nr:carbohydrate binding family 9 domain-containing protein [Gemmatimonadaceae bacterium]
MIRAVAIRFGRALAAVVLVAATATAQGHENHPTPPPVAKAVPLKATIKIDGKPDEVAWQAAPVIDHFVQFDPSNGQPATQKTEVRILYDADALYIGAWLYETEGSSAIKGRLVRRDQAGDGEDLFQVTFDTFHDHQGRTVFEMNRAGVRNDATGSGTQNPDRSWDPIYESASSIDDKGWYVEMRIPFSQLRYPRTADQTWGMQLRRIRAKNAEQDDWASWGRTESGGPFRFGHLEGLSIHAIPEKAEILPYVVSRASYIRPASPTDPFNPGHKYDYRVGADVKYLLNSSLTLDATFNPDFGQVEVDPASVNLSAFETFFEEKRPFFVANAGFFSYVGFNCFFCSNTSPLPSFYTRRIGRSPQGLARGTYVDAPENSTILGAAKVTGRTAGGMSVGILDAVTRREMATVIDTVGVDRKFHTEVEPLTNYFVGRVKQDYQGGNLVVGVIGSSVMRRMDDSVLTTRLSSHAETFGADLNKAWQDHRYSLIAALEGSRLAGSPLAINRIQRSSARYFQRPDRQSGSNGIFSSDKYDPAATGLAGYGGYARMSKDAGDWLWETAVNFRSPGFEVNDISFITRSDYFFMNGNLLRQWSKPTKSYRERAALIGAQQQFNYDGDLTDRQVHIFVAQTYPNYWFNNAFYLYHPVTYDDRLTRGGPVVKKTGYHVAQYFLGTDSRKPVVAYTNLSYGKSVGDHGYNYNVRENLSIKPKSNLRITLGPSYDYSAGTQQFVRSVKDTTATNFYGVRYVFADIIQHTVSVDTRVDMTFTPALTLQLYAQPFISSGRYSAFKEFDNPRQIHKTSYGSPGKGSITSSGTAASKVYTVDPDGAGPANSFTIGNPDFNVRSLRGTAVLRWEYRPGSTMFLVWNQIRSDQAPFGDFDFSRDRQALFRAHPDNVFLVKFNYFFGL